LFGGVAASGLRFGKVEAGDLKAVEEEAGAAGVDVVGGDAAEDFADRGLDGRTVFRQRQVEGGAAAAALARFVDWLARGVVVVAELFLAEAWTGAAASVGEDVATLVLFGGFDCLLHVFPPHGCFFAQSLRKKRDKSGLRNQQVRISASQRFVQVFPFCG
jgi:hypothetical protein